METEGLFVTPVLAPVYGGGLQPKRGSYCGPTALSALTGIPLDIINWRIAESRNSGSRKWTASGVRGTHFFELERISSSFGWRWELVPVDRGTTFNQWLRSLRGDDLRGRYLVTVTNHFLAVAGNLVTCSAQGQVRARTTRYKKSRVKAVRRLYRR